MAGELVLLKHDDHVGPGWLLDRCVARVDYFRVIKVARVDDLPPANECNGVVFTSHSLDPAALAAKDPLLREEVIFVRTLIGLGVPYLGIDGGAQLLARAILGQVLDEQHPEIGATTFSLRPEARNDPLFGAESEFPVVCWPTCRVSLNRRALVLAGSDESPRIFRVGDWTYGVLPHLEATPLMFSDWLNIVNEPPPEPEALRQQMRDQEAAQRQVAFRLMNRFIDRTSCFCHYEPPVSDQSEPLIPL